MKSCAKCKIEKDDGAFGIDKRNGALRSWCRDCVKINSRQNYYEKMKPILHPDKPKRIVKDGYRWCLKCGIEKLQSDFYRKGGNVCKECMNIQQKKRYWKNHAYIQERQKKYRAKNLNRIKSKAAIHRKKVNHSDYSNKKAKEYRKNLTDSYIRVRIRASGIKNEDITEKLIEIWRTEILLERIKKQVEKSGNKICDCCKKTSPIDNFYKKRYTWNGVEKIQYDNYCKACAAKRGSNYKKK